ncbi:MAG: hypothetical protein HYY05_01855 [Chloroflexi bacterium]|nr:hypothetical protein [Chloroflexota bacterium]
MGSVIGRYRIPEDLLENRAAIEALVQLLVRRGLINQRQYEEAKRAALRSLTGEEAPEAASSVQ